MQEQERKIIWQKWFDPLGEDDLIRHQSDDLSDFAEPDYYEENEEIPEEPQAEPIEFYKRPTKVIMTPMGIIPYNENTASNKIFNFWVGHTNFDVSPRVCSLIENESGVEALDIFTRYRFRIAIGKLFDAKTVMLNINQKVYDLMGYDL